MNLIKMKDSVAKEIPEHPSIAFIEGDGIGPDIWEATKRVVEAAVHTCYGDSRRIDWFEVLVGEKAYRETGEWFPSASLDALKKYAVSIKGPLTTPVGGGFRSLNVAIRQHLELYACVRPVRWFRGVPSPVCRPEDLDVVIFRENMEDTYAGIEWPSTTPEAQGVSTFLKESFGINVPSESGIGIKFISKLGTERIVRSAIRYAIDHHRRSVTIVHKGNIMKYTEGAFRQWAYELVKREFAERCVFENELSRGQESAATQGRIVVKDRIADNMFQQILLRSAEYDVLVMPNLNGDYMSDAAAAQVGGIGMAPGANIGDKAAVFEATHGTAPKYAGLDKANPCSLILSAVMMLDFIGWKEAGRVIENGIRETIRQKSVTYDLARGMIGASEVSTSCFATRVIDNLCV